MHSGQVSRSNDSPSQDNSRSEKDPLARAQLAVVSVFFVLFAALFVVWAFIGSIRWSHPIPYWDMWDGHLAFWFHLLDGNTAIWWELSNEHHLVLLKAIFWLDFTLFAGSTTFLVTVNLLLISLTAVTLVLLMLNYLRERTGASFSWPAFAILTVPTIALPFAWMQGEDIVFPYHAQFLMNNVIPLASFLFLGLAAASASTNPRRTSVYFWIGFALAALSPWTSASGLLIPFIAAGLAWSIHLGWRRVVALTVLGVVSIVVYSIDSPFLNTGGDGPLTNLLRSPIEVIRFWLIYLGGPWSQLTDSQWVGGVAGAIFVGITVAFVIRALQSSHRSVFGLTVVTFPVFAMLAGLVTAAGRVSFGIEQVTAIRYLTPMLTAWACIFILAAPSLHRWLLQRAPLAFVVVLLVPVLLLPEQESALTPPRDMLHARDTAALAIAIDAPDSAAITPVYPISTDRPRELGQRAKTEAVGLFARDPYVTIPATLGLPVTEKAAVSCAGWLDSRTPLEGSSWDRVDGWVVADGIPLSREVLTFTDRNAQTIGWVATGKLRDDVLAEFPDASGLNGYSGYLDSSAASGDIYVAGDSFRCSEPLISAVP